MRYFNCAVFSEKENGLGTDGYLRIQKQDTYGTPKTDSMIDIPILPESLLKGMIANIENANQIASRLKQDPDFGRRIVNGNINLDQYPDLIGYFFNWFLGASANAGDATTGYTHTWLMPIAGKRIATTYTVQQALAGVAAAVRQYTGVIISKMVLTSDNEGNQKLNCEVVGKDFLTGQARVSSFSFPTLIPYAFHHTTVKLTPSGVDQFTHLVDSYELEADLGYNVEDWKIGDATIIQPKFNAIPTLMFKCTIDADENFMDYAEQKLPIKIDLITTNGQQAGSVSGDYKWEIEIPKARLNPETEIGNSNERLKMDLEFDCGYGGSTTGSGATQVMAEFRVVDAVADYLA